MVNRELYNQRLIENLHDGVFYVNSDCIIKYWNKAAEKITGISSDEILESNCNDNIFKLKDAHNQLFVGSQVPILKAMANGKAEENNAYFIRLDGRKIHLYMRANPVIEPGGKIIGGIQLFTDLTGKPQESRLR
ncbi:MAG: PAS domain-containing protein, partial [Fidelibacterota bacterium]